MIDLDNDGECDENFLFILLVVVMLILLILTSLHLAVRVLSCVEKDSSFLEACKSHTL